MSPSPRVGTHRISSAQHCRMESLLGWEEHNKKCENTAVLISNFEKKAGALESAAKTDGNSGEEALPLSEKFPTAAEIFDQRHFEFQNGKLQCWLDDSAIYMLRILQPKERSPL